ncbi:MAG: glycosyltransferase [Pirellulales bacterium]
MRIIWLKSDYIVPPDSGGKIRTYNLLRELNRLCEVEYVAFKPDATPNTEPQMLDCARQIHTITRPEEKKSGLGFYSRVLRGIPSRLPYIIRKYRDRGFRDYQRSRFRDPARLRDTVIVCDFLEMTENVAWDVPVPKVLFQHNVESVIWDRYYQTETNRLKKVYFNYERRRMARYEQAACNQFDLVLTVTQRDLQRLRDDFRVTTPMAVIETGVDTNFFQPQPSQPTVPGRLLFLGSLDWMPNIDGMKWFAAEIYPRIREAHPGVTLQIVGRRPDPAITRLAAEDPSIEVIGNVADVRPYVAQCDLFLVPLRVGGGSRLKIFEAMAMDKPVVSTTIGAEGLPVRDQHDIVLGDSPEEFCQQVVQLLRDGESKTRISHHGYRLVTENFPWTRIAQEFHDRCLQLTQVPA